MRKRLLKFKNSTGIVFGNIDIQIGGIDPEEIIDISPLTFEEAKRLKDNPNDKTLIDKLKNKK